MLWRNVMATVEVECRFCQQVEYVKKHGKGEAGHQHYRCLTCKRTSQLDYLQSRYP
ncbi:IS1 family transposase [Xenorhabdus sp. Flor]|nr:IS1 family transposase [Xenorhabdus sp. Flor]